MKHSGFGAAPRMLAAAVFAATLGCVSLTPSDCFANTAAATVYQITVREIDVSRDGGTTWIPVGTASSSFDIASGSVGNSVGTYLSGAALADGHYNAIRVILSNTITVQGTALDASNGRTYCTDSDGTPENSVANAATCPSAPEPQSVTVLAAPPGGFAAGVTLDVANSQIRIVNTTVSFDVQNGNGRGFRIDFNVSAGVGVLNNGSSVMYAGGPVMTVTGV